MFFSIDLNLILHFPPVSRFYIIFLLSQIFLLFDVPECFENLLYSIANGILLNVQFTSPLSKPYTTRSCLQVW